MSAKPVGYIYRIFKPSLLTAGADGSPMQLSYIGRTTTTVEKRFKEHKRSAQNWRKKDSIAGDGKLHANMFANDPETFCIETLYTAYSESELFKLEQEAIEQFDSINYGWNKIKASTQGVCEMKEGVRTVEVAVNGELRKFDSEASMCRELKISPSSLAYQKRNKRSLQDAVSHCLNIAPQAQPIVVFRKPYQSINEAIRDPRLNKYGLSKAVITRRRAAGMTWEQAFSTPLSRERSKELKINTPDALLHRFTSIKEAYRVLSVKYKLPSYSSVQQSINVKEESPEQAFGFAPKPWEVAYEAAQILIDKYGYRLVGVKKHSSTPVIAHETKEVFASARALSDAYNFSYYGVVDDINDGLDGDQIIRKRRY